ncbi:MAG: HEAT repeat domain-containing protein, partial [Acidobacteria bacterium]|nr:HEAT repeat domain-containing protein [Acidobacteriota bacterium]
MKIALLNVRALGFLICVLAAVLVNGCATAPRPPVKPVISFEEKMSWILRLEDRRMLRDEAPPVVPVPPPARGRSPQVLPVPPPVPDLVALLADPEGRIRRRAALAIGRVGLPSGVQPLTGALSDADPEVRQMAAFALGLIGDISASPALVTALSDVSPLVRGRAAEALGQTGAKDSAAAISKLAVEYGQHPA